MKHFQLSRFSVAATTIAVVTVGIAGVLDPMSGLPGYALEALWAALLIGLITSFRPMGSQLRRLPGGLTIALTLFLVALLFGQFTDHPSRSYPFVRWAMFSRIEPEPEATGYEVLLESGERIQIDPVDLIPPFGNGRIDTRMSAEYEAASRSDSSETTRYEAILVELARLYEQQHPGEAVERIHVYRETMSGRNAQRSLVWTTEMVPHNAP